MIAVGEHVEVHGWRYELVSHAPPRPFLVGADHPLVALAVTPWGEPARLHVVALSVAERVWSGEWPACRLGCPRAP